MCPKIHSDTTHSSQVGSNEPKNGGIFFSQNGIAMIIIGVNIPESVDVT